jgi:hypothetical protein
MNVEGPGGMRVDCAWCRTILRMGDPERISHGICWGCAERLCNELRRAGVHLPSTDGAAAD